MPRRYAVDSLQQSTSMSSYSVHRSIPPTQGTVPTSFFYPNIPALNRKKQGFCDLFREFAGLYRDSLESFDTLSQQSINTLQLISPSIAPYSLGAWLSSRTLSARALRGYQPSARQPASSWAWTRASFASSDIPVALAIIASPPRPSEVAAPNAW